MAHSTQFLGAWLVWLVLPLLALAAVSWLKPLLGIAVAALTVISLRAFALPFWRSAVLAFGAFLAFANILVFSVSLFELQIPIFVLGALALFVMIGAGLPKTSGSALAALLLLLVELEAVMLLRFLPYGYLTLAAIAAGWHFALLSVVAARLEGKFEARKTVIEISAAATLTLIAALSSGIRSRLP